MHAASPSVPSIRRSSDLTSVLTPCGHKLSWNSYQSDSAHSHMSFCSITLTTTVDLQGTEVQVQGLSSMLFPQFTCLSKEMESKVSGGGREVMYRVT